ncbi:MAG: HEAT repeat domain-containing protein, partial [Anaerolineae bacterium]
MGLLPSPDIDRLLQDLWAEQAVDATRKEAARALGELSVSSLRVVNTLVTAMESDPALAVRRQAAESLRAPAHQDVLRRYPALMEKVLETQLAQPVVPGDLE